MERVDWAEAVSLVRRPPAVKTNLSDFSFVTPILERRAEARNLGDEILRSGAGAGKAKFAGIVVAGGTGSSLKFNYAKGLLPATPLSDQSLYLALVHKLQAAAAAHGHDKMYPLVFMISDKTEDETVEHLLTSPEWDKIRDRVIFVKQHVLPGFEQKTGKAFLEAKDRLNLGGAGHGDAFDYVLNAKAAAKGYYWNESLHHFVEIPVVTWLKNFGVEYIQFMNVDNLLTPLADAALLGEHARSRDLAQERQGRAHISLGLVRKTLWDDDAKTYRDRLGNVILLNGRKESVDYGDSPAEVNASPYGDPSIRLVTLDSLAGSAPIEFSAQKKTDRKADGSEAEIYKFERSSGNKSRYGAEVGYDAREVFAAIKTPRDVLLSKEQQSDHWKNLIHAAMPELHIPESTIIELPWEADYLPPQVLMSKLQALQFANYMQYEAGVWVAPDFSSIRVVEHPFRPPQSISLMNLIYKLQPGQRFSLNETDGSHAAYEFVRYDDTSNRRTSTVFILVRNLSSGQLERFKIDPTADDEQEEDSSHSASMEDSVVRLLNQKPWHPHIAPCKGLYTLDKKAVVSYEYLPNLIAFESLDLETRTNLAIQITEAVKYLHSLGIEHRDIKPRNVLVEYKKDELCAYLFDFDISSISRDPQYFFGRDFHLSYGIPTLLGSPADYSKEQAAVLNRFREKLAAQPIAGADEMAEALISLKNELQTQTIQMDEAGFVKAYHFAPVDNARFILRFGYYGEIRSDRPGSFIIAPNLSIDRFIQHAIVEPLSRSKGQPVVLVFRAPKSLFDAKASSAANLSAQSWAVHFPDALVQALMALEMPLSGIEVMDIIKHFHLLYSRVKLGYLPASDIDLE